MRQIDTKDFGPVMNTFSGVQFHPLAPDEGEVEIMDIAHGLSSLARYNGQTKKFYSVAEHCVLLANYFQERKEPDLAFEALMHDAAEAYIGDMIAPLKAYMPTFVSIEREVVRVIRKRFAMSGNVPPLEVRQADVQIRSNEMKKLFTNPHGIIHKPLPRVKITGWRPALAKERFLETYRELS